MATDSQLLNQIAGKMDIVLTAHSHFQTEIMRLQMQKLDTHDAEKILEESALVKKDLNDRLRVVERAMWVIAGIGFVINSALGLYLLKLASNT
jgi:hypothetical protein